MRVTLKLLLLQADRADRLHQNHPDLTSLRVLVFLDSNFYNDLVKDTNNGALAFGRGDGDGVVLRIEVVRILLERDQALQTESTHQHQSKRSRGLTLRQRQQDHFGTCG